MRADDLGFLLQAGLGNTAAGIETFGDDAGPPRPAIGASADHDAVGAGGFEHGGGIHWRHAVAIGNQRNGDRLAHTMDGGPVGAATVELAAGAAMDGHHLYASQLGAAGQLRGIEAAMVPAETHLEGHGNAGGTNRCFDEAQRMIEIAHQSRAGKPTGHLAGRTPHVDVDHLGAEILGNARAFRHPSGFASGKLDDEWIKLRRALRTAHHVGPRLHQFFAGHHFRNNQPRAMAMGERTERLVGHPGHGGEKDAVARLDQTDPDAHLLCDDPV